MINKTFIDKQLDKISGIIMTYEDGDLLLISELIDDISILKTELKKSTTGTHDSENTPHKSTTGTYASENTPHKSTTGTHDSENTNQAVSILSITIAVLSEILQGKTIPDPIGFLSHSFDLIVKLLEIYKPKGNDDTKKDELLNNEIKDFIHSHSEKTHEINTDAKAADVSSTNFSVNSEHLTIFIADAEEKAIQAQDLILKLERNVENKDLLNNIFRIFHTIKGECGFLKLFTMGELAHNTENLLDMLRNDEIKNNTEIINIMLSSIDLIFSMIKALKTGDIAAYNRITIATFVKTITSLTSKKRELIGEILSKEGKVTDEEVTIILEKQKDTVYSKKFGEVAIENNYISEIDIEKALHKQKTGQIKKNTEITNKGIMDQTNDPIIKVKASQINFLVDMIGELIIAENQLNEETIHVIQLKKITREIQKAAMSLRTVKITNLFINMKRAARDIAREMNKKITTTVIGDNLEIDRNLIELIGEPLIHLIRNAVSHGIEKTKERIRKNKNETGEIILSAERKGNNIIISVKDDGSGLDRNRIIEKAIASSIITKGAAKNLTKSEIFNLIFLPGFSTAKKIDSVSGRGVGMDIVKSTVTSARGKVEIRSEKDRYTEIRLIFPLSMAIIDGMVVIVANMHFIIPVSNIIESIQISRNMIYTVKNTVEVLDVRGEIIPTINVGDFFKLNYNNNRHEKTIAVIVDVHEKKYALKVDKLLEKREIVIKPLSKMFNDLQGISSGTILPGGKIGYILDIEEITSIKGKAK